MSEVQNFIGTRIAILRPSARTYYFLDWNNAHRVWGGVGEDIPSEQLQHGQHGELRNYDLKLFVRMLRGANKELRGRVCGQFVRRTQPDGTVQTYAVATLSPLNKLPTWCTRKEYRVSNHFGSPVIDDVRLYSVGVPPRTPAPPQRPSDPEGIPKRIARILALDYINSGDECPITMMPLEIDQTAVTSCYHVFEKGAIKEWMKTNTSCPVCKANCSVTEVSN